jgi:hypothetical protein
MLPSEFALPQRPLPEVPEEHKGMRQQPLLQQGREVLQRPLLQERSEVLLQRPLLRQRRDLLWREVLQQGPALLRRSLLRRRQGVLRHALLPEGIEVCAVRGQADLLSDRVNAQHGVRQGLLCRGSNRRRKSLLSEIDPQLRRMRSVVRREPVLRQRGLSSDLAQCE